MDTKKEAKKYLNKYFKAQYLKETDNEYKSLVRLLNKALRIHYVVVGATVPYQKCPVCEGMGKIFVNQLDPYNTNSSIGYKPCHVCDGSGIIPMHAIYSSL